MSIPVDLNCLKYFKIKSPGGVILHKRLVIRERVIIEEEAAGDVERNENVDGVVLMRCQDEENAEHVHHPCQYMQQVQATGRIC